MSASERLRELKVGDGVSLYALEEALPEIVELVEAAEGTSHSDDAWRLTGLPPHPTPCRFCSALAALEEKLP